MSDPFLDAARAVPGPEEQEAGRALREAQDFARGRSPEASAALLQAARQAKIPVELVEPQAKPEEPDWRGVTRDLPALKETLSDPNRAAAMQDDVETLGAFETLFRGFTDIIPETRKGWRTGRGTARLAEIGYRQSEGQATAADLAEAEEIEKSQQGPRAKLGFIPRGFRGAAESLPLMLDTLKRAGHATSVGAAAGVTAGAAGGAVAGGVGAVPGAAAGLVAGAGIGAKFGMTAEMAKAERGLAYREYLQIPGVTHEEARTASLFVGIANGFLEVLPIDAVFQIPGLKSLAGAPVKDVFRRALGSATGRAAVARAAGRLVAGMTLEGLTEAAQELSTVLGGQAAQGQEVSVGRAFDEQGERIVEAGIEGAAAGGVFGAPGVSAGFASDVSLARQADAREAFWTDLGKRAAESKTGARDPDGMHAYLGAVVEAHGAPETVQVPAEQLQILFQRNEMTLEQVAAKMPAVARQLEDAAGNPGVEIAVPTADFGARIARLKGYEEIVQDIRVGDELTIREAREVEKEAKKVAEEMKAKEEAAPADADPVRRVASDVQAKLEAAGADADTAAKNAALWGAFARVMGERTGKDAFAFYESIGLEVGTEETADPARAAAQKAHPAAEPLVLFQADPAGVDVLRSGARIDFEHPESPLRLVTYDEGDHLEAAVLGFGTKAQENTASLKAFGGQGYSTALYLRALEEAKTAGKGFVSDNLDRVTPATERMYARLASLGVPFEKAENRWTVAADALKAVDLERSWNLLQAESEIKALRSVTALHQPGSTADAVRGKVSFGEARDRFRVTLTGSANLSTFLHESGHVFLEILRRTALEQGAPPALKDDLAVLEKEFGVPLGGKWTEDQLERFARGFERYLMEGKAPSSALVEVFRSFKSWLVWVYKTLTRLDVELTDEVRGVMDRLLATEAEIAAAREESALLPIESAELAGMTEAEYAAYRERFEKGVQAAQDDVERRALAALRRTMGEERARVRADVAEVAKHRRDFNAREFLRAGERLDGQEVPPEIAGKKLDRDLLDGLTDAKGIRRLTFLAVKEGGIDPDDLAPYLGYASGQEMVQELVAAPSREAWVRAETDRRMLERYPEAEVAHLADDAARAVHEQDGIVKALRAEMDAVGKRVGAGPARSAVEVLRRAAKERAAGMTDLEMRPDVYRRAEAKAAREFLEALAKKDFRAAHDAKRRQLFNHFLAGEVQKARDEVERIREFGRSFEDIGKRRRIGKSSPKALAAIDAILEGVGFRRISAKDVRRRQSLARYVAEMEAEGDVVAPELKEMAELKSYREMTLDELRAVEASLANLEAMARLKGKLLVNKEHRDLARTAAELSEHIRANLGTGAAPSPGDISKLEAAKEWLRSADADMKKVEFIARILDGGKTAGLAHSLLFQPLRDAQNERYLLSEKVHGALVAPFEKLSAERRIRYARKVNFLPTKSGKMVSLSLRNVLAVALNLGNDGNRERLLKGYGWSEEQVLARLDQLLDDGDLAIVEHIWKSVDSLWPAMKDLAVRHVGLAPKRVEATPVTLPSGRKLSGGYYPIVKSRRMSYLARQLKDREMALGAFESNFFAPVVEHGFTKSRGNDMSPLDLSLDVVPAHLDKVIHYLTHYEGVRAVDKLIQRGDVREAITEGLGGEYYDTLRPWLENIAADGNIAEPLVYYERIFRSLRFGSSIVLLFGKIPTGIKQALGLITSRKELKRKHLVSGVRKFLREGWAEVREESPEFKFIDKQLDRDTRELFTALESSFSELGKLRGKIVEFGAMPIMLVQKSVNAITWYAAREQAMEEGHPNPRAYADSIVTMTQTGGGAKDLAAIQRGSELRKMFTVMFSYRSVLYNQLTEQGSAKSKMQKAAHFWWLVLLPVVVEQLVMNGVGDDEDLDDVLKRLSLEVAFLPLSTVPFAGDIPKAAIEQRVPRVAPWIDTTYRAAVAAGKLAEGDASHGDARAVADFVGMATQLPTAALWNYGTYVDALLSGELEEPVQDLLFRNPSKWE